MKTRQGLGFALELQVQRIEAVPLRPLLQADNTITARHVQPDARRIRGLLKSPHAVPLAVEQMDDAVAKHLLAKHAPGQAGRKSAGR